VTAPVGIVLVSHSEALAAGVVDLAAQMAPDVLIVPAAGTDEGGLGTWVPITGSFGTSYMMAYEASRPVATSFSTGSMSYTACSSPNRQPWTNLTQPEAEAACAAAGGRLCTEQEWQTGCESTTTMCDWSYASSCATYQSMVCNDVNYDFDPGTPGDQNGMLATASLPMCYAGWSGGDRIYDMSGNAEEWTAARQPGINPLRGGSNNDTSGGTRCDFDFIVADDLGSPDGVILPGGLGLNLGDGVDFLSGGDGSDYLIAFGSNDTVLGGAGDDLIEIFDGASFGDNDSPSGLIQGGSGNDVIRYVGSELGELAISFGAGDGHDLLDTSEASGEPFIDLRIPDVGFNDITIIIDQNAQ